MLRVMTPLEIGEQKFRKVQETQTTFSVGMVEIPMNPMLEARYTPLTPPDFRIF